MIIINLDKHLWISAYAVVDPITVQTNTPFVEGQCSDAKLPDTVNVAIQIDDTQVHERYATKQNDFGEKSIRIISKCSLNQEISGSLQKY
ncbi:unnamed protein product [Rotaria socialis]